MLKETSNKTFNSNWQQKYLKLEMCLIGLNSTFPPYRLTMHQMETFKYHSSIASWSETDFLPTCLEVTELKYQHYGSNKQNFWKFWSQ